MSSDLLTSSRTDPRAWLFWAALALGVGEVIDAFNTPAPATGILFGLLVAAGAVWLRLRGTRIPVVLVLLLAALELALLIFIYPHGTPPPSTLRLGVFIVLAAAVVILSILSLVRGRPTNAR
jgi:peptidoglycan/LPS O-acetylase OafA/YrhL